MTDLNGQDCMDRFIPKVGQYVDAYVPDALLSRWLQAET